MDNPHSKLHPEQLAEANQQQEIELANAYTRLLGTPDGQIVFGDLNSRYLTNDVQPHADHSFLNGCKAVMVYIITRQQLGANNAHQRKS